MRSSRTFWGAAILLVGLLLLLQNLGVIDVNIWAIIWPLLIILLGIQILAGMLIRKPETEAKELALPLAGITEALIVLEHGAGQITLDGHGQAGSLLKGQFNGGVRENVSQTGGKAYVNLKVPDDIVFWPAVTPYNRSWNISLSPEIPLDLQLKTGASENVLDLSDLLVRSLRIDTGASSTRITVPTHAGYTRIDLHSGAASIKVTIPQGVAARIESKGALSSTNVDRFRFPQAGNVYQSADYANAANRVDILIESGVGSVDIQ